MVFTLGSQSFTTDVLQNNKAPTWPEPFEINWDGISDLKVFMYDSNWFYPDALLGSLQLSLLSASFPDNTVVPVGQLFDNSESRVSFSVRMNHSS